MLAAFWQKILRPLIRRPALFQVAALVYRWQDQRLEILLVSSLTTKQWILPKGWPMDDLDAAQTARKEAFEEAGAITRKTAPRKIGSYSYAKHLKEGVPVLTNVDVFAFEATTMRDDYPERDQRKRRWATLHEAIDLVESPSIKAFLRHVPALLCDPNEHGQRLETS